MSDATAWVRSNVSSGGPWEDAVGYSRAVRFGPFVKVSGTTSVVPDLGVTGKGDAYAQAKQAFATIGEALRQAGATLADVVQTRMYLVDIVRDSEAVGRAHAEMVGTARPAATMVGVAALIDPDMLVEIEVEAIVAQPQKKREEEWRLTHRARSNR